MLGTELIFFNDYFGVNFQQMRKALTGKQGQLKSLCPKGKHRNQREVEYYEISVVFTTRKQVSPWSFWGRFISFQYQHVEVSLLNHHKDTFLFYLFIYLFM